MITGDVAYFQGAIAVPIIRVEGRFVKLSASLGQGYRIWILVNWDRMLMR